MNEMKEFKDSMKELTDLANSKKEVAQPYFLYTDKQHKFELKKIMSGFIVDRIIELSKKYPLDLKDQIAIARNDHEIKHNEFKYDLFKKEYKFTDRQLIAFNENDIKALNLLDKRSLVKERFELHKKLFIEVVEYKNLDKDLWKLISGKTKESKEFWQNQDVIMLRQIWDGFRNKMQ